ncbi:MAG: TIGR04282 family arsenosugar biosynthesis glycosyltransferase [Putridiphycobacter sp.]
MSKDLLIVFVKPPIAGKVKTRLAKSIGDQKALEVYLSLLKLTHKEIKTLPCDVHIYSSGKWENDIFGSLPVFVQKGHDLGEKMVHAFQQSLTKSYERIILIGSDLPDLNAEIILNGFKALSSHDTVFGPALDGGYYLIGMKKNHPFIFTHKPWSQPQLLQQTLTELKTNQISYHLLQSLNDIDTLEDLKQSILANQFNV